MGVDLFQFFLKQGSFPHSTLIFYVWKRYHVAQAGLKCFNPPASDFWTLELEACTIVATCKEYACIHMHVNADCHLSLFRKIILAFVLIIWQSNLDVVVCASGC